MSYFGGDIPETLVGVLIFCENCQFWGQLRLWHDKKSWSYVILTKLAQHVGASGRCEVVQYFCQVLSSCNALAGPPIGNSTVVCTLQMPERQSWNTASFIYRVLFIPYCQLSSSHVRVLSWPSISPPLPGCLIVFYRFRCHGDLYIWGVAGGACSVP